MLKEKKPIYFVIMLINLLMITFSAAGCLYLALQKECEIMNRLTAIFGIIAIIAVFIYFFNGSKKDHAIFFKLFVAFFAVSELTNVAATKNDTLFVMLNTICFGLILLVAIASNLGKFKSLTICSIVLAIRLGDAIRNIVAYIQNANLTAIIAITGFALASVLTMCVYAKYVDKEIRHSEE